jgi:alkaline phosphatase D
MSVVGDDAGVVSRRSLLRGSLATLAVGPAGGAALVTSTPATAAADGAVATHWLGHHWWGNRLQDWVRRGDRLECVAVAGQQQGRTVSVLTWEVTAPSVVLRVRTGTLTAGAGFSGFLIGTGAAGDDWRTRVLVGAASGTGGGVLATYESDGTVRFREHTDEAHQLAYTELPSTRRRYGGARRLGEDALLELAVSPRAGGAAEVRLRAFTAAGALLASAVRLMPAGQVTGGVGLMSSELNTSGARYWFAGFRATGTGARSHPARGLGPIVGTLFTVSGSGLRMTAQLMPVDRGLVTRVWLQVREDRTWRTIAGAPLGAGYTALFRVPGWDRTRAHSFRVLARGYPDRAYTGTIPAQPAGRELVIASLSCVKASHRNLDRPTTNTPRLAGEAPLGLYTQDNIWFPHNQLAASIASHHPDLLVTHGDVLYETNPTPVDPARPRLDFLNKYLLWLWSFRNLTRNTPTVVLIDDHDVYQPNLWGAGGIANTADDPDPDPADDARTGGYLQPADWVNLVQQTLCAHNPTPYDPTPVEQGIGVYYTSFTYGGVSFAVLEDRKFKSAPDTPYTSEDDLVLLGQRQEDFLRAWTTQHPGRPKVVLTQTMFACVHTKSDGTPMRDQDTNGWPAPARNRALTIIRNTGALILSGDQHLGALVRHGIGPHTGPLTTADFDGPVQFTAPAGSASFQRWFEPGPLPGAGATPHTGHWVDGFNNPVHVLAVVQPQFTRADYETAYPTLGGNFGDRNLKNEGYGIIRIHPTTRNCTIECWRWDHTLSAGNSQYPGFPHTFTLDEPT